MTFFLNVTRGNIQFIVNKLTVNKNLLIGTRYPLLSFVQTKGNLWNKVLMKILKVLYGSLRVGTDGLLTKFPTVDVDGG